MTYRAQQIGKPPLCYVADESGKICETPNRAFAERIAAALNFFDEAVKSAASLLAEDDGLPGSDSVLETDAAITKIDRGTGWPDPAPMPTPRRAAS